jgi:ABC-2 type transport system permease protein
VIFNFLFYFLGGYLLYGALFAAVGSAVDSPAEAQQFMFPITIPMLIAYLGLFMFILDDPHGPISVWLSIIPFTSPIAMMGRFECLIGNWHFHGFANCRICVHDLGGRKNLPCGHPYARHKN